MQKYGFKKLLFFPESPEVRKVFEHITNGELEHLQALAKKMPANYILNMRNATGYSPLIIAADSRRQNIVKFLLDLGADPDLKVKASKECALHRAIYTNDLEIVKLLVEGGANIELESINEMAPAVFTILRNKPKILDYLLE